MSFSNESFIDSKQERFSFQLSNIIEAAFEIITDINIFVAEAEPDIISTHLCQQIVCLKTEKSVTKF